EGLGRGYEIKQVVVATASGRVRAFSYYATRIDSDLRPFHWYKQLVLAGARENGLPAEYIARIERVVSMDDPDPERILGAERILSRPA
ncbi:MAG: gamma-glutamylcyclotransferase, partial [Pseudomonadota bacterium]|nr:gamma-glutamylcyclotransferase [Pseudomonadota bacterium]